MYGMLASRVYSVYALFAGSKASSAQQANPGNHAYKPTGSVTSAKSSPAGRMALPSCSEACAVLTVYSVPVPCVQHECCCAVGTVQAHKICVYARHAYRQMMCTLLL